VSRLIKALKLTGKRRFALRAVVFSVWENADPPCFLSQNRDKFDGSAGHPISPQGKVSTSGSKVRIRFKVSVIENACLVARAVDLMTNDRFLEGYSLIREMQANDFLIALLAEHGLMIKKLCDFKERHKTKETESIAALLTRAAERGDEEAISLLAEGALERRV
jgi:hypothetical protein